MGWWDYDRPAQQGGWPNKQQQYKKKIRKASTYSICGKCGHWHWDSRWVCFCKGCGKTIQPTLGTSTAEPVKDQWTEGGGGDNTEKTEEGKPKELSELSEEAKEQVHQFVGRLGVLLGTDIAKILAGHLPTIDNKGDEDKKDPEQTEVMCWEQLRAARAKETSAARNKHKADKNVTRLKEQLAKAEERATTASQAHKEAEQQLETTRAKYLARVSPALREQHEKEAGLQQAEDDPMAGIDDAELLAEIEELDKERAAWMEKRKALDEKKAAETAKKRRKYEAKEEPTPPQPPQGPGAAAAGAPAAAAQAAAPPEGQQQG